MSDERLAIARASTDNALTGLAMIRETIETLGPPGILPSQTGVVHQYGPEPVHEAQAIVDALRKLLARDG